MPRFAANLTMLYYAKALHCTQLNCLAGIAPPNVDRETLRATFVGNRRFAPDALGGAGIRLLIEPVNTYDIPGSFSFSCGAGARDHPRGRLRESVPAIRRLSYAVDGGELANTSRRRRRSKD